MGNIDTIGLDRVDVLFIGAGPASLAGAIRLKQLLNEAERDASVVVIEKAAKLGQHNLSGAVFHADVLDELIPDWKEDDSAFVQKTLASRVERDEVFFLLPRLAVKVPPVFIPSYMRHRGDYVISISELVNWLADHARSLGVEIYPGFVGKEVVVENGAVVGIKLGDKGLDKEGQPQSNYERGETLRTKIAIFGDGSLGVLSEQLIEKLNLRKGKNPQIYSLGVKEIIRLSPEANNFGTKRAVYTMGFPSKADIFGGGTLYSLGENTVALAINLSLDWRYCDLDPQRELQMLKSHWLLRRMLRGGEVVAYGARTIPEGGYYSLPEPVANGAIIIGDAAGLLSTKKLKGLHYAIKSGILAAETAFGAIQQGDFSTRILKRYETLVKNSFIEKDLREARNYRQLFARGGRLGIYTGTLLSLFHRGIPGRLKAEPDYQHTTTARRGRRYSGGIDKLTDVSLSGTQHREDEPSHITILDPEVCLACGEKYGCHPCEPFCPGQVYKFGEGRILVSPSNCLHCQTCRVKCPYQNIHWEIPEGGDGPKYKLM